MTAPSGRLVTVLVLTAVLSVSIVDLFAKPWRRARSNDLLTRAERAVCFEQPEAAQKLLSAAEGLDAKLTATRRAQIASDQSRVVTDLNFARQYFNQCGNTDRVAVLNVLEESYTTPKAALDRALELANKGEITYAKQLVSLAGRMNPDYAGVKRVSDYLGVE